MEGFFTTIPLSLSFLLLYFVFTKQQFLTLFFGLILGIFLDIFYLRPIGQTPLFFTLFLFLAALYKRKFEINTVPFVLVFSFLGSLAFLFVFNYENIILEAVTNSFFAVLIFKLIDRFKIQAN